MPTVMSDYQINELCKKSAPLKKYILPDSALEEAGKLVVLDELLVKHKAKVGERGGQGEDRNQKPETSHLRPV